MGTEIERKFLVCNDTWRDGEDGKSLRQGYLCLGPPVAVRVRVGGGEAILNVKKATVALTRNEFEYAIPLGDGEALLAGLCTGFVIEKTRYKVNYAGNGWEVDVFHGANEGLIVAELELDSEDQPFEKPPWAGEEVSHDPRYLNTHLSQRPYSSW
jgi:adenylate cyclase